MTTERSSRIDESTRAHERPVRSAVRVVVCVACRVRIDAPVECAKHHQPDTARKAQLVQSFLHLDQYLSCPFDDRCSSISLDTAFMSISSSPISFVRFCMFIIAYLPFNVAKDLREPPRVRSDLQTKQAAKFSMAPVILASQLASLFRSFLTSLIN